ncbi:autophagy protein Apg9-domain-containing protein [Gaertneriomyces semiglobifer]|nr:autophagy protein Apg9-domain-containing protein [Gaertneriomyces semiglobifer]
MYQFFNGKGFYCIILTKLTNLLTSAFVVAFSTFLFGCVDYSLVHEKKMLAEIIKPQCLRSMHWIPFIILLMFSTYWTFEVLLFALKIPQLSQMYQFIYHGLGIDDTLMQTISWRDITVRLNMLSVERGISLDAHAIANRIMRKDNYMVALFNKDILDLRIPRIGRRQMLTSYMELNIQICIFWCVFDHKTGMVRKEFLREANRPAFARELRKKFFQVGVAQLILIPFLVPFRILYFFFQYAEEYHQNPSALGSRQYSPLAWWKFREFNELEHIFRGRLNRSYNHAIRYMNQFPNYKLSVVARFTAFITGSFLAVLVIFSMVSEELLHGFEITPDRSAFFYIGIFGTIMAVSRGMVPDENQVFEPARLLRRVAEETHYLPTDWRGKLHLEEVRYQFSSLFDYKIMLFVYEIMSVLYAPFILLFSLPKCADSIVDFFREFTVHVNSLGYVCSFAVFDFKRHGNANYGAPGQARDDHYISKEGKMEQSFLNFKMHNPDWEPGVEGSQYLNTRNVKFDEDGMHDIHRPALADAGPSRPTGIPQTLHPMHAVGSQIFHPGRGGSSLMPPRPAGLHPYMAGADSAQLSDTGEGNGMGRALFAVLDAIYESNRASY